jgi:site-specific recombinase
MSFYRSENPFKIIKIVKHLDFSDSRFSNQQLLKKSHFSEKRNQTGLRQCNHCRAWTKISTKTSQLLRKSVKLIWIVFVVSSKMAQFDLFIYFIF